MSQALGAFHAASHADAVVQLLSLCGSRHWADAVATHRPYADAEALLTSSMETWFSLSESDWLEAFACHPRIGEKKAATTAYLAHSDSEQSLAQSSLEPVAEALLKGNRAYEEKFGFLYIVFASGRTAPELLALLEQRLNNTREEELQEAARQQHLITSPRMQKWLGS